MIWRKKTPFVQSGEIFDKEKFVTIEKARVLTGNISLLSTKLGFYVKYLKLSINKGR